MGDNPFAMNLHEVELPASPEFEAAGDPEPDDGGAGRSVRRKADVNDAGSPGIPAMKPVPARRSWISFHRVGFAEELVELSRVHDAYTGTLQTSRKLRWGIHAA